ncbi:MULTISPECIES: nuclear transport factor 2 family protein [Sphingomonas]|uniref:nuclear transport factor 2 family protein n=1 Tax=Sphingomonas TaxID=13687 RepID=UPI000DEED8D4|nr:MULTISPECIES: nuclear transport factor 2 family protein [Sphingomonas]
MDREQALGFVMKAYAARAAGDKALLAQMWTEDAEFRIAGDPARVDGVGLGDGNRPMDTVAALIDRFRFEDVTLIDAVVEGRRLALHWRVMVIAGDHMPAVTELMDLVTLAEDGRIASLVQFADTALIRYLAA